MYSFSQEQVFIFFFFIGMVIGMLLDFFRAIRKCFKTSDNITLIEDILFLIVSGSIIVFGILNLNNGEIRFFIFLAIFFGLLIYFLTISNLCVIILYVFVNLCKKILKIPFLCFKKLQNYVFNITKKDF